MPEPTEKPPRRRTRAAKPKAPQPQQHKDMVELVQAMQRLADALEPLSEHVPVLIEIAKTWNAAATTGRTIGRGASMVAATSKGLAGIAIAVAAIWAIMHQKWDALLGAAK